MVHVKNRPQGFLPPRMHGGDLSGFMVNACLFPLATEWANSLDDPLADLHKAMGVPVPRAGS